MNLAVSMYIREMMETPLTSQNDWVNATTLNCQEVPVAFNAEWIHSVNREAVERNDDI